MEMAGRFRVAAPGAVGSMQLTGIWLRCDSKRGGKSGPGYFVAKPCGPACCTRSLRLRGFLPWKVEDQRRDVKRSLGPYPAVSEFP